ncbi:MAG: anhydro-N-acetylmuramic acid kinase [Polyangia bacterium]
MHPLARLLEKPQKRVLGLMSGTSADGLDCALVTIEGHGLGARVLSVQARTYPYSAAEREYLHGLFRPDLPSRAVCEANFRLGELFASGALRLLAELGVSSGPDPVDLIGSHGQTVWHQPPSASQDGSVPSTLQLGEPAVIAARTGVVTVGDFRVADVALGGEGAPLVPYADYVLFREPGRRRALQNIGGIANVTVLADRAEDVIAFDNGPGNMLIDALAKVASGGTLELDLDGQLSARGQVLPDVLAHLLDDDYLRRPPPKSTGRERYGRPFAHALLGRFADRRPLDLLATAVALTARAIADSLRPLGIDELMVSGGGAHNRTLMASLQRLLDPIPVRRLESADGHVDIDNKEAVAFALLAVQAVHGEPTNLPSVTGAALPAVLGKICLPPPASQRRAL